MTNHIPTRQRTLVRGRDRDRCARCGGRGAEWHHRRSRSVHDGHTHCTCNGVLLCNTCHRWAHDHPFQARSIGMIVSRHAVPRDQQMEHVLYGWVRLTCDAKWSAALSYEQEAEGATE